MGGKTHIATKSKKKGKWSTSRVEASLGLREGEENVTLSRHSLCVLRLKRKTSRVWFQKECIMQGDETRGHHGKQG